MKKIKNQQGYVTFMMLILSVLFITGCGGGGSDEGWLFYSQMNQATPDNPENPVNPASPVVVPGACAEAGPRVISSIPANGDEGVTVSTADVANDGKMITITFSESMDPGTIVVTDPANPESLAFTLRDNNGAINTEGTVAMNISNTVATFTTTAALNAESWYTVTITKYAKNALGTSLGCTYIWEFRTGLAGTIGQAPINLGLAAPFGIATAAGLDNTGATKVNGDVVLNPDQTCNDVAVGDGNDFGLCGGAPPTNNSGDLVITQIHPDTTTADAVMADLKTVYLSIMPANLPGATSLACANIGSGGGGGAGIGCAGNSTLPPGVYIAASASSIVVMGTLVLDGGGDPNAIFVFQMASTLTTAVNSEIQLTGGTKASNVFWQVGSSATIGANTIFNGNVLADTSITMNTGATSCGRMLAGAVTSSGAFTFDTNVVSVPGHTFAPVGCK